MNAAEWAPAGVEVRIESQFPTVRRGSSTRVFTDQDFEERLQIPAVITTFLSCCLDDDSERGESRALLPFVRSMLGNVRTRKGQKCWYITPPGGIGHDGGSISRENSPT